MENRYCAVHDLLEHDVLGRIIKQVIAISAKIDFRLVTLLVQFLIAVASQLMASFLPLFISDELNHPLVEATYWTGIAQSISASLHATSAPLWGFICDRVGTKKTIVIALAGNAIGYSGMAVSASILHLILFRGLQGSFGGLSTILFILVASSASGEERKKTLSYQMAAMTVGHITGPGLGGLLASAFGYRLTLATSALVFAGITPLILVLSTPPSVRDVDDENQSKALDFRTIIPDVIAIVLVYACISFITPTVPWFLESLGIPYEQLLPHATVASILSSLAFAVATIFLSRLVTDRTLFILSAAAAGVILTTAFVTDPYQFIALQAAIGSIQAGIPPHLFGGESARKGTAMGFLNSARFIGMALGPFVATSILGNGEPPKVLHMFITMTSISLLATLLIYLTHARSRKMKDK